jgi:hypothetical protein
MKMGKMLAYGLAVFACLYLFAPRAAAQYRASIQGVVTDPQGATIAGATVTLQNEETGQTYKTESNENGIYNFNALPPSKFTITVEKAGFKTKVTKGIGVISEQANGVNVQLEVGTATESVTVSGNEVPLIDTETSNLQGTVNAQQIQTLPSFGRDPFQLLQLAPGAFGDGAQVGGSGSSNLPSSSMAGSGATDGIFKIENGGQITANGQRVGSNNYQIDGVGTTSVTWGGASVVTPNEESVKEVKVVTDNYDAENGRYAGAQVQIISQSGTNNYHGSFFFKAHRPGLNAFQKYNGQHSVVRDENRFNNLGGSIGGPILRNKLFVFFSYERLDNNAAGTTDSNWYETPQLRALAASGTNAAAFYNFPGAGPNGGSQTDVLNGQTLDCANIGLVEGSNCHFIPGQGLDIGSPLTSPLGTGDPGYSSSGSPGVGSGLDGVADIAFFQGILNPSNDTHVQYNGRIDFTPTKKDLIAFSIYWVPNSSTFFNDPSNVGVRAMNNFNSTSTNRSMTALWDHTFNPTLVNEARVNASGWLNKDLDSNPNAPFGLPVATFNQTGSITIQGLGVGSFNGFDQWTYAAKDVLTKVAGAHTMKMGGEVTRLLSVDAPFWADRPSYTFNNIWDFLNDAPIQENAQFDPQTGIPSALRKDLRSNVIGLFFQDNWKVKPNLTLTAGLRWEYFGSISEKNGKLGTVEFGSGPNLFTDISVRTGGHQFSPSTNNFGPQLGFAWTPRSFLGHDFSGRTTVVRGGFGIAYNGIAQSNTLDVRFNPPFVQSSPTLSGSDILYINSFPSDVNNPNGYAPNPAGIVTFGPNNLPTTGRTELTALPPAWPTTTTLHYTFGIERELGGQWVASIGYQGSTSRHLTQKYNLYNVGAVNGIAFNPNVSGINYYTDDGTANFNALLLELKRNFTRTFSIDAQYRFSHSFDTGSNAYTGADTGNMYEWDLSTNYGSSDYDVRHAFKLFGVWSPRFFRGEHSWAEKLIGGWTVSGILNAHTGFPWTPYYGGDFLKQFNGNFNPVFSFGPGAGGSSSASGNARLFPAAYLGGYKFDYRSNATVNALPFFTQPDVVPGTLFDCLFPNPDPTVCAAGQQGFGPLPTHPGIARNLFEGPRYFDVDATLSKSFGLPAMKVIGENAKVEFRANFYNLFNKLNLAGGCSGDGIQCDITNSHFGESQKALGSRTIELQARFSF